MRARPLAKRSSCCSSGIASAAQNAGQRSSPTPPTTAQPAAVLLAGHRHQPGASLRGDVERGVLRLRALRAPAGRMAVDDALVERAHIVVAEPELLHDARAEVVDHHIGLRDELADDLAPFV